LQDLIDARPASALYGLDVSAIDPHEMALLQIEAGIAESGKNVEMDALPGNVVMDQADNLSRLRQSGLDGCGQQATEGT
jgi:hypothetical protein